MDTDVLAVTNCVDDEKLETESSSLSDPCHSHEIAETSNCRKLSDTASKENQDEEEIDDPQNQYRASVNETCLQSFVPDYPITINYNDSTSVNCNDNQHTSAGNEYSL